MRTPEGILIFLVFEKRCIERFGGKDGVEDCARRRVSERNRRIAAALGAEINRQGCLEVNWPQAKRSPKDFFASLKIAGAGGIMLY